MSSYRLPKNPGSGPGSCHDLSLPKCNELGIETILMGQYWFHNIIHLLINIWFDEAKNCVSDKGPKIVLKISNSSLLGELINYFGQNYSNFRIIKIVLEFEYS